MQKQAENKELRKRINTLKVLVNLREDNRKLLNRLRKECKNKKKRMQLKLKNKDNNSNTIEILYKFNHHRNNILKKKNLHFNCHLKFQIKDSQIIQRKRNNSNSINFRLTKISMRMNKDNGLEMN